MACSILIEVKLYLIRPQMHHDQRGLLILTKVFTSSKAIPLSSIGYPSFIGKWGSTSLGVIIGHSGMGICICPSQLPKDLHTHQMTRKMKCKRIKCRWRNIHLLTCSSGVGEYIFSSWGCLERSKGYEMTSSPPWRLADITKGWDLIHFITAYVSGATTWKKKCVSYE